MKRLLILFLFFCISGMLNAQNTIRFSNNSDSKKVTNGTTVIIAVDTAYVIGKVKAVFIEQKIKELQEIKVLYNNMADNHNKLLDDLTRVQTILEEFKKKVVGDSISISQNFKRLIADLDVSLKELKANNSELKRNNDELKSQVDQLEKIIAQLRKETRGIWWNGLTDKLVAFAGGIGVGMVLMLVLSQ